MHFHDGRGEQPAWDPLLIDCGRRLLASYPLDQVKHRGAYRLAELVTVCLSDSESATEAKDLCRRVFDATTTGWAKWHNLERLIETLFGLQPLAALDCWFAGGQDERGHSDKHLFNGGEDRNPLSVVPLPLILEWANGDPNSRFPRLAGILRAFEQKDGVTTWSEGALALVRAAPNRAAVLRGLATQLRPRACFGSLADILERRRPLFQGFLADDDPGVRQVARETDESLQREIASERRGEVNRDERFE